MYDDVDDENSAKHHRKTFGRHRPYRALRVSCLDVHALWKEATGWVSPVFFLPSDRLGIPKLRRAPRSPTVLGLTVPPVGTVPAFGRFVFVSSAAVFGGPPVCFYRRAASFCLVVLSSNRNAVSAEYRKPAVD